MVATTALLSLGQGIVGNMQLHKNGGFIGSVQAQSSPNQTNNSLYTYEHSMVDGRRQVFLKSNFLNHTIQLSHMQNTANPSMDGENVVWEGFMHGTWQIFMFDGIRVVQLTSGDISVNPNVEGDYVTFGRKGSDSAWYAELYNIKTGGSKRVAEGIGAKRPMLETGEIVLVGTGNKEYTGLTVSELLPGAEQARVELVTEERIKRELGVSS